MKQILIQAMMLFGCNLSKVNPLKCISMNNQECKIRPEIVYVTSDEPVFYPFNIKTPKSVVLVTISMMHMQKCVFLILWKT